MAAKLAGAAGRNSFSLGQNSEMNVTPFVDVMLVLLIVFMVAAPLATVAVRVDVPPAWNAGSTPSHPPTYISIADGGQISVSMSATQLRTSSLAALGEDVGQSVGGSSPTDHQILIRADRHVPYRRFMDVINQLQADGYYRIGLISEAA